jgi:hypothetical protein
MRIEIFQYSILNFLSYDIGLTEYWIKHRTNFSAFQTEKKNNNKHSESIASNTKSPTGVYSIKIVQQEQN